MSKTKGSKPTVSGVGHESVIGNKGYLYIYI